MVNCSGYVNDLLGADFGDLMYLMNIWQVAKAGGLYIFIFDATELVEHE